MVGGYRQVSSFFKLEGGVLVGKEKRNDHLVWVHPKMAKTASSTKLMQWWVLGHTSPFNLVQGKILAILCQLKSLQDAYIEFENQTIYKGLFKEFRLPLFCNGQLWQQKRSLLGLVSFQVFFARLRAQLVWFYC